MYTLIIEDKNGNIADEISFEQGSYTIGRVEGNDIILPSNAVSRTHARIYVQQGRCFIDDLGSANGVLVDGEVLKNRKELRNASQIRIGDYLLYLEHADKPADGGQDVLRTHIVAANQNAFKLVRVGDMFAGEEFGLTEQVNTIGRTDENFILLSDPSISRAHAQIVNEGMAFRLVDLGSSNGTRVNGKPLKGQVHLRSGDEVQFGNVRFVFVPGAQVVNLTQFARARSSGSGGSLMVIVIVLLVLAILGGGTFAVLAIVNHGDASTETTKPKVNNQPDPSAELAAKYQAAVELANEQDWNGAQRLLTDILTAQPGYPNAGELQAQVLAEIEASKEFDAGDELIRKGDYLAARPHFEAIPVSSAYHKRASSKLQLIRERLATATFVEAKLACDKSPNLDCIAKVCEALSLNPNDKAARPYLDKLLGTKEVKKSDALKNAVEDCKAGLPPAAP